MSSIPVDPSSDSVPTADIHTFLIADVRGYTAFTLEHGDEAAARLAARFADLVGEVVAARDGQVVELRGDEALVVFTSARQALRAAVDLQTRLVAEVERDPSLPLKVGIGLDAGEAIPVKGGFRGAALNMAARLCSLAGPGEVLASDGVIHLARKVEGIEYTERGLVQLKGFSDPVRVLRVQPAAEERSDSAGRSEAETGTTGSIETTGPQDLPIGGFLGALPATPLVARAEELGRVLRAVDGVAGGTGRLVLIAGEPGVGKTRLAQEVTLAVRNRGFTIAAGRCYEGRQTVPFYPFVEALTAAYASASAGVRSEAPRRWPDLARLLPSLGVAASTSEGAQDQQRMFWAVAQFLQSIAAVQPLALLLDDLHWADATSLELVQHVARHTRRDRVLLLGTFRGVDVHRQHPLEATLRDLQREELVDRVDLRRLEEAGTAELMAASMGEEQISDEFSHLVYERTEGNPFFIQQVMRSLVERGDLFRRDGQWDRKAIAEIEVPESIRSVVGQRLSRLPEETQEVLHEASVLGQSFTFDDLAAVTARPEKEIEDALAEAARAGLVRETGPDQYSFDHALTQQSLYVELTTRRRRRLHLAAGEAIEALPERKRDGRAAELAWHFLQADDAVRALVWSLAAGNAAIAVFAYRDAELQYRTAAELAGELERVDAQTEALEKLGRTLFSLTRLDEAVEVLEDAARQYQSLGDVEGEMRVVAHIGRVHTERLTRQEGIDRLAPLLERAPTTPSPALVELQVELARLHFFEGRYDEALVMADQATALAQSLGDDRLLGQALGRRAGVLACLSRSDEALEVFQMAIELAERTGDLYTLFLTLNNLSIEQTRRFWMEEAEATRARQLEVARRMGTPADIAWVLYETGRSTYARGKLTQSLVSFQEAASIVRVVGAIRAGGAVAQAAAVRLFMGDEIALAELEEIAKSPYFQQQMVARAELAQWDLVHDSPSAALERLQGLRDNPDLEYQFRWYVDLPLARALARLGEIERAEAMATAGIAEGLRTGSDSAVNSWLRTRIEVRVAQGRTAEAQVALRETLAMTKALGIIFAEAQALFDFGAALVRAGAHTMAQTPLQQALALFREIGSPPLVRRTEELLETTAPV